MGMHRAGAQVPVQHHAGRKRRAGLRCNAFARLDRHQRTRRFHVDQPTLGHHAQRGFQRPQGPVLRKRRIDEDQVESAVGLAREPGEDITRHDVDHAGAQLVAHRVQGAQRGRMAFHQRDPRRAARGGLEAERAGTGEEIGAAPAGQVLAQPVEQGLANAIAGRAQALGIDHRQRRALVLPADDPHLVRRAGMRRGG